MTSGGSKVRAGKVISLKDILSCFGEFEGGGVKGFGWFMTIDGHIKTGSVHFRHYSGEAKDISICYFATYSCSLNNYRKIRFKHCEILY